MYKTSVLFIAWNVENCCNAVKFQISKMAKFYCFLVVFWVRKYVIKQKTLKLVCQLKKTENIFTYRIIWIINNVIKTKQIKVS